MTWLPRLASSFAVVALFAAGCSTEPADGGPVAIESLFPADNEVGTWVEDTSVGASGVEVASTPAEAEALIDGDAEPFTAHGFSKFAIEHYVDGTPQLELRVWEMPDAAGATEIYDYLVANDSIYMASSWEDVSIGAAGRASNTGASWWVNARSGAYYIEAKINDTSNGARTDAQAFASAVIGHL